ncbi:MAG: hypothetical protein RMJ67_01260 [Elusimicrobiota bacterium]|nr:hypothetical protein [Endomicrobiia bacterium]MDW8165132.1 hypothetical protein [Elusimicrobiota bacterium]
MKKINLVNWEMGSIQNGILRRNFDIMKDINMESHFRLVGSCDGITFVRIYTSDDGISYNFEYYTTISKYTRTEIYRLRRRFIRFEIEYLNATYLRIDAIFTSAEEEFFEESEEKFNEFLIMHSDGTGELIEINADENYVFSNISPYYCKADKENRNMVKIYDLFTGRGTVILDTRITYMVIQGTPKTLIFLTGRLSFSMEVPPGERIVLRVIYPDRYITIENRDRMTVLNNADFSAFLITSNSFPRIYFTDINVNDFDFQYTPSEYQKRRIVV